MRLEELKSNVTVRGPLFPEPVQVIVAIPTGPFGYFGWWALANTGRFERK
jgi:hypothetical protein